MMQIQEKDIFHGAALTQVVEHKSFKALNRATTKYGHYLINSDRALFVKYRKPNKSPWQHTFSEDDVAAIVAEIKKGQLVFLCLVCGTTTVCALDSTEIQSVLDLQADVQQWIRVEIPKGGSCHVSGTKGKLKRAIPHSSFPDKLFK
jgi:hypothetical protein